MADDDEAIIIRSGATQTVSPMALIDIEGQLDEAHRSLRHQAAEVQGPGWGRAVTEDDPMVPYSGRADDQAVDALRAAENACAALRSNVAAARENYTHAESTVRGYLESMSALQGTALGFFSSLRFLGTAAGLLPAALGTIGLMGALGFVVGTRGDPAGWFDRHKRLLSSPSVIRGMRYVVSGTDNFMLTALGIPPFLVRHHDDVGTGRWGEKAGAGIIAGAADAIAGDGGEVVVERSETSVASAPERLESLVERIPTPSDGEPQIRIERYDGQGGKPLFAVYIAGTIDPMGFGGDQVFDMGSNIEGVAELDDADSLVAVRKALEEAGAKPGDDILPVGFSQGAIVASNLADDDTYNTVGTLTAGGPLAQHRVETDAPVVRLELTDDPIPSIGGLEQNPGALGRNVTVIQGSAHDAVAAAPDDDYLPAHHTTTYADLAGSLDETSEENIARLRTVLGTHSGSTAQVTTYTATRHEVPEGRLVAPGPPGSLAPSRDSASGLRGADAPDAVAF